MKCLNCGGGEYEPYLLGIVACKACGSTLTDVVKGKIEAMQAVIAKLPVDNEGRPVVPGVDRVVWLGGDPSNATIPLRTVVSIIKPDGYPLDVSLSDCVLWTENCDTPQPCGGCPGCDGGHRHEPLDAAASANRGEFKPKTESEGNHET